MNPGVSESYDLIAEFYDEDMGRNASGKDISYYVARCKGVAGPVLELGCGTGRIALPIAQNGSYVVGIDRSQAMLRHLLAKSADTLTAEQQERLVVAEMDICALGLRKRFSRILCPFSTFTYLVDLVERRCALEAIRELLKPDGLLLLDVFIPSSEVAALRDDHVFFDYDRPREDGTRLVRTKMICKDIEPGVNLITRLYRMLGSDGEELRRLTTGEQIRYYFPDDLVSVLSLRGLEVLSVTGDFGEGRCGPDTKVAVYAARLK